MSKATIEPCQTTTDIFGPPVPKEWCRFSEGFVRCPNPVAWQTPGTHWAACDGHKARLTNPQPYDGDGIDHDYRLPPQPGTGPVFDDLNKGSLWLEHLEMRDLTDAMRGQS